MQNRSPEADIDDWYAMQRLWPEHVTILERANLRGLIEKGLLQFARNDDNTPIGSFYRRPLPPNPKLFRWGGILTNGSRDGKRSTFHIFNEATESSLYRGETGVLKTANPALVPCITRSGWRCYSFDNAMGSEALSPLLWAYIDQSPKSETYYREGNFFYGFSLPT